MAVWSERLQAEVVFGWIQLQRRLPRNLCCLVRRQRIHTKQKRIGIRDASHTSCVADLLPWHGKLRGEQLGLLVIGGELNLGRHGSTL